MTKLSLVRSKIRQSTTSSKIISADRKCCCPCILVGGECELEFIYVNVNAVQDDTFNIELKRICNGQCEWIVAGEIDGTCKESQGGCACREVDTVSFKFKIDQSYIFSNEKGYCQIEFRAVMTKNNGCGTFGTFDVKGPKCQGFGGFLGDAGFINIAKVCEIR